AGNTTATAGAGGQAATGGASGTGGAGAVGGQGGAATTGAGGAGGSGGSGTSTTGSGGAGNANSSINSGAAAAAPGGAGGSQTQSTTAASATNDAPATGNSTANSGAQSTGITQSGQCAANGINIGGQKLGVANLGNGNKSIVNNGDVLGVLLQNLGDKTKDGVAKEGSGYGSKSITTTINAVNNVGNANGQAAVGKGSKPNQNSTQTFNSH